MINEQEILNELSRGSHKAFQWLFDTYYKNLVLFAGTYLKDLDACEDVVQQTFVNMWDKREELPAIQSIKSFLVKSVQNACISELRRRNIQCKYADLSAASDSLLSRETEEYILYSELRQHLEEAMKLLTPHQRQCFELNKLQGVKQQQIAEQLGISLRTVELRVSEALKILRRYLEKHFQLILLFWQSRIF